MENFGTSPSDNKFIDEITMKILTNNTNYAKYLHKTDNDKFEEQQQFIADCKVFYKDIISMTKDMCQCKNNAYGSDVNESFNNYARSLIRYLEVKHKSDELQKEYEENENMDDELFPLQNESESDDDSKSKYGKKALHSGTLDLFVRKK
jgi:hypothetical protein